MANLRLENKTARILHISTGGGATLAIPPVEGGITVQMSDSEKAAFDANVATDEVQSWITGGVLVITDMEGTTDPPPPPPEGETGGTRRQEPPTGEGDAPRQDVFPDGAYTPPEPPPEVPEHVRGRKRSRDD
jgi:hypothetical protein